MKILLLEDEKMLRDSIKEYLESTGHIVTMFADGKSAFESIQKDSYDMFLFDVNVPLLDGFELLESLNSLDIHKPTIYITAMTDIEDIQKGFDIGCNDYLKKPFHLKELALRIEKVQKDLNEFSKHHIILSENYSYDRDNEKLFFKGEDQRLTKKQLEIIDLLAKNLNNIVTFNKFRNLVWGNEFIDNATIRAEIHRLKSILKDEFILNIRGVGYKIDKYSA
jgi:DNA-binding response OmpR family regulator